MQLIVVLLTNVIPGRINEFVTNRTRLNGNLEVRICIAGSIASSPDRNRAGDRHKSMYSIRYSNIQMHDTGIGLGFGIVLGGHWVWALVCVLGLELGLNILVRYMVPTFQGAGPCP